jgi:hypothetical protein
MLFVSTLFLANTGFFDNEAIEVYSRMINHLLKGDEALQ